MSTLTIERAVLKLKTPRGHQYLDEYEIDALIKAGELLINLARAIEVGADVVIGKP